MMWLMLWHIFVTTWDIFVTTYIITTCKLVVTKMSHVDTKNVSQHESHHVPCCHKHVSHHVHKHVSQHRSQHESHHGHIMYQLAVWYLKKNLKIFLSQFFLIWVKFLKSLKLYSKGCKKLENFECRWVGSSESSLLNALNSHCQCHKATVLTIISTKFAQLPLKIPSHTIPGDTSKIIVLWIW